MKKLRLFFISITIVFILNIKIVYPNQGGPDGYGYIWTDTIAPAPITTYSWDDIATTGTNIGARTDDQVKGPYDIGFTFNFYGNNKTEFYIGNNGGLLFDNIALPAINQTIPNITAPNNIIVPFWDNLYTGGTIYYETKGTAPDKYLVVQYEGINHFDKTNRSITFQVILFETTNAIKFQYEDVNLNTPSLDNGYSATVGIENNTGTVGLQYSYNTASLAANMAILFSKNTPPNTPSLVTPADNEITSDTTPTLTANYSDPDADSGLINFQIASDVGFASILASGSSGAVTNGNNGSWTPGSAVSQGTRYWRAQNQDVYGSTSTWSASYTIIIDATQPITASVTTPGNGSTYNSGTIPATFQGSIADNASGAGLNADSSTFYLKRSSDNNYWTGAAWGAGITWLATTHIATTSNTSATWSDNIALPAWVNDTYYVKARAIDKAGNTLEGPEISFIYNRIPNVPSLVTPLDNAITNDTTPTLTANYSDPDADSGQINFQIASDVGFTSILASGSSGAVTNGNDGSWTPGSAVSQGTRYWRAQNQDVYGSTSTWSASYTIIIDATQPITASVTIPGSGSTYNSGTMPATFQGNARDNADGSGLNADSATFYLKRSDNNYWDGIAGWGGSITWLATTHATTTGNTNVTWSDNIALPAWVNGTYYVKARAIDKAGNILQGAEINFIYNGSSPNTPSLVSPVDNASTSDTTPTLTANYSDPDADAGLINFQIASDTLFTSILASGSSGAVTNGNNGLWTPGSAVSQGTRYWRAQNQDTYGYTSAWSAYYTIIIDATQPTTASVTTPSNGSTYNPITIPATFQGSSADNASGSGLNANSTTFYLKRSSDSNYWTGAAWVAGVTWLATTHTATTGSTSTTWSDNVALPAWVNGTYYVRARAIDKAGNILQGAEINFIYNRVPNVPSLVTPADNAITSDTTPTLTANYSDPDADAGQINFQIASDTLFTSILASGSSGVVADGNNGSWTPGSAISQGSRYWRAQNEDSFGATSSWSAYYTITIDTTPVNPINFTNESPTSSDRQNTTTVIYQITAVDFTGNTIDITSIEYRISSSISAFAIPGGWQNTNIECVNNFGTSAIFKVEIAGFNEGIDNYIQWRCKNSASTTGTSNPYQIKIQNNQPPQLTILQPNEGSYTGIHPLIQATVSDEGEGIDPNSITIILDKYQGANITTITSAALPSIYNESKGLIIYNHQDSALINGEKYTLTISVKDRGYAQPKETIKSVNFMVKQKAIVDFVAYPSPFNPRKEAINFSYTLSKPAKVTIRIYNIAGKPVNTIIKDTDRTEGEHNDDTWPGIDYSGQNLASGVYLCELVVQDEDGEHRIYKSVAIFIK